MGFARAGAARDDRQRVQRGTDFVIDGRPGREALMSGDAKSDRSAVPAGRSDARALAPPQPASEDPATVTAATVTASTAAAPAAATTAAPAAATTAAVTPTTTAAPRKTAPPAAEPARLRLRWLLAGIAAVVIAMIAGLALGPVGLNPAGVFIELLNLIPGVHLHSGLTPSEQAIVVQLRLPRVCLGLLVGAMLALAGGTYQGVFRNPLADPYLLGIAAGAGLGATLAIVGGHAVAMLPGAGGTGTPIYVPFAAFVGALVAVTLTYALGAAGGSARTPAVLLLAGVAVTAFLTAGQTYLQQQYVETIREVYSWIMGRLTT